MRCMRGAAQLDQAAALVQTHELLGMQAQIAFESGQPLAKRGALPAALAAFARRCGWRRHPPPRLRGDGPEQPGRYHTSLWGYPARTGHIRAADGAEERYALSFLCNLYTAQQREGSRGRGERVQLIQRRAGVEGRGGTTDPLANVRVNQDRSRGRATIGLKLARSSTRAGGCLARAIPFVRNKIAQLSAELA